MKRLILILLAFVSTYTLSAQKLLIYRASKPPKLDGIIDSNDPWQSNKWTSQGLSPDGSTDLGMKSKFQLMWDDENLYFAVQVEDSNRYVYDGSYSELNDGVTLYISMDSIKREYCIYGPGETATFIAAQQDAQQHVIEGLYMHKAKISIKDNGTGYVQEWQIPWIELYDGMGPNKYYTYDYWDGRNLKIDVKTMDYRPTKDKISWQTRYWNSTVEQHCAPHLGWVALFDPNDSRKLQYVMADSIPLLIVNCSDAVFKAGASSGLIYTIKSSNEKIATVIDNKKIHVVAPGKCYIIASQAGNSMYKPAKNIYCQVNVVESECFPADMVIYKTGTAPVIDGIEDNMWKDIDWQNMIWNKGDQSNSNNIAKFKMTYDKDYIYTFIDIQDATIDTSQSRNVWEKDCAEIYFAMDTTPKSCTNGINGNWSLRKIYGRPMTDYTSKGFIAQEQHTSNGYTQEWRFAWDSLTTNMDATKYRFNKESFKFEISNADNDGYGRNSQFFWHSNADDSWCSTYHYGRVVISPYYNSIDSDSKENKLCIYPNPVINSLFIKSIENIKMVEVYDLNARLIISNKIKGKEIKINVERVKAGLYLIKVTTDTGVYLEKIIVSKQNGI